MNQKKITTEPKALTYQAELLPAADRRTSIFVEAGTAAGATFCTETVGLT